MQYRDHTTQEILAKLLPENFSKDNLVPSSFEVIGHIAHLNLKEVHMPFKKIIG